MTRRENEAADRFVEAHEHVRTALGLLLDEYHVLSVQAEEDDRSQLEELQAQIKAPEAVAEWLPSQLRTGTALGKLGRIRKVLPVELAHLQPTDADIATSEPEKE